VHALVLGRASGEDQPGAELADDPRSYPGGRLVLLGVGHVQVHSAGLSGRGTARCGVLDHGDPPGRSTSRLRGQVVSVTDRPSPPGRQPPRGTTGHARGTIGTGGGNRRICSVERRRAGASEWRGAAGTGKSRGWSGGRGLVLGEEVLQAAVLGGVVGLVVLPAAPDHIDPGAGQDPHGVWVVVAAGDGLLVELRGPRGWRGGSRRRSRRSRSCRSADQRKLTTLTLPDWRIEGLPRRGRPATRAWGSGRGSRGRGIVVRLQTRPIACSLIDSRKSSRLGACQRVRTSSACCAGLLCV